MRRFILFVVLAIAASGCLPNPQSEWVTSEGGEQRSTLDDETIQAGNTLPKGCGCVDDDVFVTGPHVHTARAHVGHIGHIGHVGGTHIGHAHTGHH